MSFEKRVDCAYFIISLVDADESSTMAEDLASTIALSASREQPILFSIFTVVERMPVCLSNTTTVASTKTYCISVYQPKIVTQKSS